MPNLSIDHILDKLIRELEDVLEERGTTRAEVQRQLGWGNSRISDLKANPSPLKVSDMLEILAVVGVEPSEFLKRVHGQAELPTELAEIQEAIETLTDKLSAISKPDRQAPAAARRVAWATTLLLGPMTRALSDGASAPAIETALMESVAVALFLCAQSLEPDQTKHYGHAWVDSQVPKTG